MMLISGFLLLLAAATCLLSQPATAQVRPPNYSPDAIPETSFTCENKITGGYYADAEAECQLFHVCVQVSEYEVGQSSSLIRAFLLYMVTLMVIHLCLVY